MDAKDSNGNILKDGDTVQTIKYLKVKGVSKNTYVGNPIKDIHLIINTDQAVYRIGKSQIILKT